MMNPMEKELERVISKIKDKNLRQIVLEVVANPQTSLQGFGNIGLSLEVSPAGRSQHHSYPGGLIEHIVSTSKIAMTLCDCAEKVYHGKVNRDFVLAGVLLHDIFKPLTFVEKENGTYGNSLLGEKLDHLTLVICELYRRNVPIDLLHIVAAHHGKYGPISPRTIEALIVHVADVADATFNNEILYAGRFLCRECTGVEPTTLSAKDAFNIIIAKQINGCESVKALLKDN